MQRSPPPRYRRKSPPQVYYRSPDRRPSPVRHDYPDRYVSRRRGEAGASGNNFERVPAWALPPRDDVFSPREGHLGDKLDLLTRMLREMKTEMKGAKSRQRKRRYRPRAPPAQPTIITIPGQQPPPPQPAPAPAVINSGGSPNVVPYPIYIPTPGGYGGYGGGGGGGAPRQSGSWSSWFGGGGASEPPPPPSGPPPSYGEPEPDYTYFEEGGIRGMLGLEAFNDETIGWIVLIGIAGLIAVQELERQRMEWGPRDMGADGRGLKGAGTTSWDEMLYGPYATVNITEGNTLLLLRSAT